MTNFRYSRNPVRIKEQVFTQAEISSTKYHIHKNKFNLTNEKRSYTKKTGASWIKTEPTGVDQNKCAGLLHTKSFTAGNGIFRETMAIHSFRFDQDIIWA